MFYKSQKIRTVKTLDPNLSSRILKACPLKVLALEHVQCGLPSLKSWQVSSCGVETSTRIWHVTQAEFEQMWQEAAVSMWVHSTDFALLPKTIEDNRKETVFSFTTNDSVPIASALATYWNGFEPSLNGSIITNKTVARNPSEQQVNMNATNPSMKQIWTKVRSLLNNKIHAGDQLKLILSAVSKRL